MNKSWKDRLYECYVSSGQARQGLGDKLPSSHAFLTTIIRDHFPVNRETEIVDLGCGHGILIHFLKQAGYTHIKGVDVSEEQVKLAHDLGVKEVIHSDMFAFLKEQPSNTIDLITSIDVLEHLERQELFEILDQIWRVLRDGGLFIAHIPNAEGMFGMRVRYGDFTHELSFTRRSIESVLTVVGFEHITCLEDRPIPHSLMSFFRRVIWDIGTIPFRMLLVAETGQFSSILSQNMMVTARKSSNLKQ